MPRADDLLQVLAVEHRTFAAHLEGLAEVAAGLEPAERRDRTRGLRHLLWPHVVVEHVVVHPLAARTRTNTRRWVRLRLEEVGVVERHLVAATRGADDAATCVAALEAARGAFAVHEDREELEGYPYARHATSPQELRRLARWYRNSAVPRARGLLDRVLPEDPLPGGRPPEPLRAEVERLLDDAGRPALTQEPAAFAVRSANRRLDRGQ